MRVRTVAVASAQRRTDSAEAESLCFFDMNPSSSLTRLTDNRLTNEHLAWSAGMSGQRSQMGIVKACAGCYRSEHKALIVSHRRSLK